MNLLVAYDVVTTSSEGRRRLRRVARVCQDYGQRVQFSIFECSVGELDFTRMRSRLIDEINPAEDSLRLYRLTGEFSQTVESFGRDRRIDFEGPLIA